MKRTHTLAGRLPQRGYTLTEVMVAITISLFLLAGLFTILQQTRNTARESTGLSQLQDDERVAMTIITDVIQQAGYFPDTNGSPTSELPVDPPRFINAGQVLVGGAAAVGESITVRYELGISDNALNCLGQTNNHGTNHVYKAAIQIDVNGGVNQLTCSPDDGVAAVPLVNNVTNLTFTYAVNTTGATSQTAANAIGSNPGGTNNGCPADTYIPTANMALLDWTNVCAVKVDITFVNPLYQPAGQPQPTPGQPQTITFERVISILGKAGVNVTNITQT